MILPGVTNACYRVTVTNDIDRGGDIVWQQDSICADDFGDGIGAITYVGPCDADVTTQNSVTIELLDLMTGSPTPTAVADGTYVNPCGEIADWSTDPDALLTGEDDFGPCTINHTCVENADEPIEFNLTIMRDARQGFFDIAVNFEDIFCSAKLDTCYPDGDDEGTDPDPIALLFSDEGVRSHTAVIGLACSAGAGTNVDTNLLYSKILVNCNGTVFEINPRATAGNNTALSDDGSALGYGIYYGTEDLPCIGGSCNKEYWNIAINLEDLEAFGTACKIELSATANDGNEDFAFGLPTADGLSYPYIDVSTLLTNSSGVATCQSNPLNGPGSAVVTKYHGELAGDATPLMVSQFSGGRPTFTGALAYLPADCRANYVDASATLGLELGELPAEVCGWGELCLESYLLYSAGVTAAGGTPDPLDQAWADENCVSLRGQVLFDEESESPVAFARIVIEPEAAPPTPGGLVIPAFTRVEVLSDGDGYYQVPLLPKNVSLVQRSIYFEDELVSYEVVKVDGQDKGLFGWNIIGPGTFICVGASWASAWKQFSKKEDKMRHCMASCRTTKYCGLKAAWGAAIIKEFIDMMCSVGPSWLRNLLNSTSVSGCGGWDSADMAANNWGFFCGFVSNHSCKSCCEIQY